MGSTTSLEALARLKPAFIPNGASTAGNSSQISDGAAAVLMTKHKTAKELNLPLLGIFRSYAVVGVPPHIMGIGPALAIPEALKKVNIEIEDVDIFEIKEAFAVQVYYSIDNLKIPFEKVNP